MKPQRLLIVFAAAFGVTLALVVGQRLSTEAMAVIIGVMAGVAASIPTSLIIVWVARGALAAPARGAPPPERRPDPPERDTKIIIVPTPAPGYPANAPYLSYPGPLSPYAPAAEPRHFTMIGGEAADEPRPPWR